jgi:hypothetical protein
MATYTLRRAPEQHQGGNVAGAAYRRAGRPKHISHAHGAAHRSTGTRYQQGAAYSPLARAVEVLVQGDHCNPWPALVEAHALVIIGRIRNTPTPMLIQRRAELEQEEFGLLADAGRLRYTGESMRDIRAQLADLNVELLAIETELDGRKAGK